LADCITKSRKFDINNNNNNNTNNTNVPGDDECVTELEQALIQEKPKNDTISPLCEIEKRYSHSGRDKNGDQCNFRIRMRDVSCENFQFPLNSSCYQNISVAEKSPQIYWENVPSETKSFVLVMENRGKSSFQTQNGPVLWFVADISYTFSEIEFGASQTIRMPALSVEYANSLGRHGFTAPCADDASESQMIAFHLFAMVHPRIPFRYPINSPLDTKYIVSQISKDVICSATLEMPLAAPSKK